jgi:DNA topoisomerase-1
MNTVNTVNTMNTSDTQMGNDVSYNKRQFWEYKRLYGGSSSKSKTKTLSPAQNKAQTRKVFHLVNNKIATDKHLVKRLTSIYIPPAYKDIVVAKSANNKIQAIGTDKRGRRQYVYNNNYTKKRNDRKYEDIMELAKKISAIEMDNDKLLRELVKRDVINWDIPDDYIPIIVYMLRTYHFRIGNERYVNDNHSYGITTLRAEHIKWDSINSNKFTIEFIGKKGILNQFSDNNPLMAKLFRKLIEGSKRKGHDGFLFKYIHEGNAVFITPEHIQAFFQEKYKSYITPKMFRTWYGNYHLLVCLRKMFNEGKLKPRLKKMEKNEIVRECSEHVSSKLNNTPTVSKQSYIDDKILELVMQNPYRLASTIPDTSDGQHQFLYKIILKLRKL